MHKEIQTALKLILARYKRKSKPKLFAFTGSGISRASNIPTFQGEDGLWEQYDFNEVATAEAWLNNPAKLWDFYKEGISLILEAKPNAAHFALAELEQNNLCQAIITQNADSLHQRAGSKTVYEIHGNILRLRCVQCNNKKIISKVPQGGLEKCSCGGIMRPDVVLYHEQLPETVVKQSHVLASQADVCLVIGTSAIVYPAAGLPFIAKRNDAIVIVFNTQKTDHAKIADVFIKGKCEKTLPIFVNALLSKIKESK
jgi:NAD-dependent deacetylase